MMSLFFSCTKKGNNDHLSKCFSTIMHFNSSSNARMLLLGDEALNAKGELQNTREAIVDESEYFDNSDISDSDKSARLLFLFMKDLLQAANG